LFCRWRRRWQVKRGHWPLVSMTSTLHSFSSFTAFVASRFTTRYRHTFRSHGFPLLGPYPPISLDGYPRLLIIPTAESIVGTTLNLNRHVFHLCYLRNLCAYPNKFMLSMSCHEVVMLMKWQCEFENGGGNNDWWRWQWWWWW
jgi:hypothetical protein